MDLHFTAALPDEAERAAVDAILGPPRPIDAQRSRRELVLPLLHAVVDRVGWISEGALNYVSDRLTVAPADVYGVASFYALFPTAPRARTVVFVCDDVACRCDGALDLCAHLESTVGPAGTGSDATWVRSPCLGLCDAAPAALVTQAGENPRAECLTFATPRDVDAVIQTCRVPDGASPAHVAGSPLRLLRRVGRVDPSSLDDYCAHDGYRALRASLEIGAEATIAEVTASKLVGRGGAAFPTGQKMDAVARAPGAHYLVCNADESEPGTFKDRVLMENDPFALVEAMTIAAIAAKCERGYAYVRGEYPLAARRLSAAVERARERGLLGDNVMGSGIRFDIEIRRGAGAYICGEETALFNSIEGKRGEPRNKPPFPTQSGLFGRPTLINNVETLANLPLVLLEGGAAFAQTGTPQSTGTRLFSLSGAVVRPGVYEVAHGTTMKSLIEMAGGVPAGRGLQAILLGGAAGALVAPDVLDLRLTFEDARAAGVTLGSGVVMLFDDRVNLRGILHRVADFFAEESCGQCVPCRVGTVRQVEVLERLGRPENVASRERDLVLLGDIGRAMRDASICGLGQTAANLIESACKRFDVFGAREET